MTLLDLRQGEEAFITKVRGRGAFRRRLQEMGFVSGKTVKVVKKAPLRDPVEYAIMGYNVSLRNSEARLIDIIPLKDKDLLEDQEFKGTFIENTLKYSPHAKGKVVNVALVGNPNCGKTTLFNYASGSREHVGNYSGVTVDAKKAKFKQKGYLFNIIDLPGTYSISAYSPEELFVRNHIFDEIPDVVVNVIDSSNLERNLYLTTQLIDMDIKVVVALNMYDELTERGDTFDYESLGKMIGIPMVPTISSRGKGIRELFDRIIEVFEDKDDTVRHIHINYGKRVEKSIFKIQEKLKIPDNYHLTDMISSRYLSIKLLEKDPDAAKRLQPCENADEILTTANKEIEQVESCMHDQTESIITDAKYGFIAGALRETLRSGDHERRKSAKVLDNIFTHKLWGYPIFLAFLWLMFSTTFSLGKYPMYWIDAGVEALSLWMSSLIPDGMLKELIIEGIIGGIGGVIVFLPNILILFFFISLMEDTGYMARAVFIMDKLMHKIGLHGKSFIPLIMGFGCTVPAILSTRTIENRNDRMITMLINPFISCSAKLPVYILLIGAFFPEKPGLVLFSLYIFGMLMAFLAAIIFKKTLFRTDSVPFVMELPPFRVPTLRSILRHMWHKAAQYLKKIGGVILIASIIIWALGYFPRTHEFSEELTADQHANETNLVALQAMDTASADFKAFQKIYLAEKERIERDRDGEALENSYIGRIGKWMEPSVKPLGFDWKMGVSILTGFPAKEIVVSTMGVLYQSDASEISLPDKLQAQTYKEGPRAGEKVFSPLVALAFMVFILLYFPCIGTVTAISKESGSWKWGLFTILYTTSVAWLISLLIYQVGSLMGF